jgi:hypothetical protein
LAVLFSACAPHSSDYVRRPASADGGASTDDGGALRDGGWNTDGACADVTATATLTKKPVDIIFVIDNSGSMSDEIKAVESNINTNFAQIIGQSGLDYRVIMLSQHGTSLWEQICVQPPLSGNPTCSPPPLKPVNSSTFFHYSQYIDSHDSLARILSTYNQADPSGAGPSGWSGWLRADALKIFIEITDDESDMTSAAFETALFAKSPNMFGDAMNRNYVFHSIVGLKEDSPATMAWKPTDPIQNTICSKGGGAVAPGVQYQQLSQLTGGLRFPICEHDSFDAVFKAVATGVVAGAQVACSFEVPKAPMNQTVDLKTVVVRYTPATGTPQSFTQVASDAQCQPGAFYIANQQIVLCPATCSAVKADDKAKVDLLFDCQGVIP